MCSIALIDTRHIDHHAAHDWFVREGQAAWATCPITENGVIRIVGHQEFGDSLRIRPVRRRFNRWIANS